MKQTEHYQLNQWEYPDRILMDDFNDAMASIDAGMKANANAASSAQSAASAALAKANAAQSAANSAFSATNMPFVVGSYVGQGNEAAHIGLGFRPSFVIVSGIRESADGFDPAYFVLTAETQNVCRRLEIMPLGFCAYPDGQAGVTYPRMNELGRTYDYIAFR